MILAESSGEHPAPASLPAWPFLLLPALPAQRGHRSSPGRRRRRRRKRRKRRRWRRRRASRACLPETQSSTSDSRRTGFCTAWFPGRFDSSVFGLAALKLMGVPASSRWGEQGVCVSRCYAGVSHIPVLSGAPRGLLKLWSSEEKAAAAARRAQHTSPPSAAAFLLPLQLCLGRESGSQRPLHKLTPAAIDFAA